MSHPSNILSTSRLAVGYRNGNNTTTVLSNLDLSLRKGELVCLLGANGAGKSTLLRTLSGVQQPIEGSVHIDGKDLNSYSKKQISRLISIVYTDRTLAGALTVYEIVSLGRHPYTGFLGWQQKTSDVVQLDMTCRPCSVFGDRPCFRGDYHCLYGITPQMIIQKIEGK